MVLAYLHYYCILFLLFQLFWVTAVSCPSHNNPTLSRQDYIIYYIYTLLSFINIGKLITYRSYILWSKTTHICFSHPRIQWVRDFNIQLCHGWWRNPWLQSSWNSPFQYPQTPLVLPLWSFLHALLNILPRCFLSQCKKV